MLPFHLTIEQELENIFNSANSSTPYRITLAHLVSYNHKLPIIKMRAATLATGMALIATSLAIPCVTQMTYYNPTNKDDGRTEVRMCWDTETKSCRGNLAHLAADRRKNQVSTCTHNNGKLEWHLGTGWTIFGIDLFSFDIEVDVSQTDCTVIAYHPIFIKYVGLPLSVVRTDDKPESLVSVCPI
ncbi:hypothetical protein PTMSG1_00639 [Pyrenophora teres f. maculata]|nr:hypothetical protein PTMSG1_00639 [Pyrenophora teres f. maculata]